MDLSHHGALLAGYATAMLLWLAARRVLPQLWPPCAPPELARPGRELVWALLAAVAVIGVGQLYQHGWRLPTHGTYGPLLEAVNQLIVFSPMIALLVLRRAPLATAWLPTRAVPLRIAVGLVLAVAALASFACVRARPPAWPELLLFVYRPEHVQFAVQVFLEDLAIAIVFVRLAAWLRRFGWRWLLEWVAIISAASFAAGHVPAALGNGAALGMLLLDFVLVAGVLLVLFRSADIWWFCCVHFAMDMTQFAK